MKNTAHIILAIHIFALVVAMGIMNKGYHTETHAKIDNYQVTIDSLIQKNERLNNSLIDVWNENAIKNASIEKLTKDVKWLRRIKR